jgi:spermidine/putrescine transport system substrate-binding protein
MLDANSIKCEFALRLAGVQSIISQARPLPRRQEGKVEHVRTGEESATMSNRDRTVSSKARSGAGGISRRRALATMGGAGLVTLGMPYLAGRALAGQPIGPGGIPLARPDQPVKLPLWEDPIKAGLAPESGGNFVIYVYQDYIDKALVTEFCKKHGVEMQMTTFDSMDEAITRLATGAVKPDVFNITPDRLAQAVAGKLIKPINHDYVANLAKNVWPGLQNPFYDVGSQYTVPYTVYTTGIGWRADKIAEDVAKLDNPWSIFWNSQKYKGYVGLLDDSRDALSMAMLYRAFYDINTEDPAEVAKALSDLKALVEICNPKVNITEYQTLATGQSWLHQSWSGDLLGAFISYLPQGDDGSNLRYWSAPKGRGVIGNDCWCVCSAASKPVLGHMFLDYVLDQDVAYKNFTGFTGYQPPQNAITADKLIADKIVPENLRTAVMGPDDVGQGALQFGTLTPKGQKLWQDAYAKFTSGT